MNSIEKHYQAAIDALSPKQRVAKSVEMFHWSREFIGRQVRVENPDASEKRLKLLVALRMYGGEPSMKRLLEGELANVPN